jgi:HPt (histidine-containing phosphotransfer) domain-containing protein
MIDESVITKLKAALGDDGAVIQQLIDLYAKDSPQQVADAELALERRDMAALARAAHSLKSTSATMGATTVSALALELELHAKQSALAPSAATLERLRPAVHEAVTAFSQLKF